DSKDVKEWYV
nr:Chain B, Neurexin 1 [Drosophila melanogaster]